ncbi:MAG TPA: hypothetical protein VMS00_04835 [Acidimicrobiales bacterium]|nr:hypothetical protein [Acidimicrobiales bacterium]
MFIAGALIATTGLSMVPAVTASAVPPSPPPPPASICTPAYTTAQFGPNVCVFTPPSGPNAASELTAIQTVLNNIATQQVPLSSQFDSDRYALLFEPGTYGSATYPLVFQVGYYTQVAGLGAVPQDTIIYGQIDVFPNALDSEPGPGNCFVAATATCYWANSTVNFWRSLSNLDLNVMTASSSRYVPTPLSMSPPINDGNCFGGSTDFWSVSQATPVRSVIINGNLNFQSYCSETNYQSNNYGSGSYVANSEINGQLDWSGNQQGVARNSDYQSAVGYVWNYVYSGDSCPPGYTPVAPATACSPTEDAFNDSSTPSATAGVNGIYGTQQITELPQSPVTQEEPFLYTDSNGNWNAFVPAVQHNSAGPNFLSGTEAGTSLPLSDFFIASPSTPEFQIQAALDHGQDLVLTPGVYDLNAPIVVRHPDTIVLGLGFATLVPQQGNASMVVGPNYGVKLSGMIFDAGPVNSPVLLSVGTRGGDNNSANDPDLIQDIFFRVGGAETTPVSATVSLLDSADNSIIDDVWAWRADHGANTSIAGPQGQVGAGWTYNQGNTGLEVTGDNVTAYGLAIEHYQQNEVIWSGNNGTVIFFQNELPYDPPSQTAWQTSPVQPGYPSFLVTNNVQNFNGYGMASYVVFIYTNATLWDSAAFEAPQNPGVQFTDTMDLFISSTCQVNGDCPAPVQSGGDDSVIDGVGGSATFANVTTPVDVNSYVNGVATLP